MAKYIIDVPDKWVDITNGLHIPIETGWDMGDFRIDTGLKLTPYTEPDLSPLVDEAVETIENEVWELADYMCRMSVQERDLCFGFQLTTEVTANLSYQEAKSKFEAWMKMKDDIRVGDEVIPLDTRYDTMVVTKLWASKGGGGRVDAMAGDGKTYNFLKSDINKTGRHFPEVEELLKKMRDADED